MRRANGLLAGALLTLACAAAARAATPVEVALRHLDALEQPLEPEAFEEQQALARMALEMAGRDAWRPLAARLREGSLRRVVASWAIGQLVPEAPDTPAEIVTALRRAAGTGDWDARLGAATALGRLRATAAAPDLVAAWSDPTRPPATDGMALLALAGVGGSEADAILAAFLARGGDGLWARTALAACLRRGPEAWPLLVDATCAHWDPTVRATAALALILLAEPRAGCALAECAGAERDVGIRRLQYQALGAGRSPSARAFLRHAATIESDAQLGVAASVLAGMSLEGAAPATAGRAPSAAVREGLARLANGTAAGLALEDVEGGAAGVDLPAIERTLRLLPLRPDSAWLDDHARLAQLRARLLCSADPDCEPRAPRVGRPERP